VRKYLASLCVAAMIPAVVGGCSDGEEGTAPEPEPVCNAVSIVSPASDSHLGDIDDRDKDCDNGIQVDVKVATNAPDGTRAALLVDGDWLFTRRVTGASVVFENVTLPAEDTVEVRVQVGGELGCHGKVNVTTDCVGPPSCEIVSPVIGPTHPELNNVPVAEGGDRASPPDDLYRVVFRVATSAGDGPWASLSIDGVENASVATVADGVAVFPRVRLEPDGPHAVSATCFGANGKTSYTATSVFPVDTEPPSLMVTVPPDNSVVPGDVDTTTPGVQFNVCGTVGPADALDLPESLGAGRYNFCASTSAGDGECVQARSRVRAVCAFLDCPSDPGPFNILVTLLDDAGNYVQHVVQGVSCQ
jgi:hypothetical protein